MLKKEFIKLKKLNTKFVLLFLDMNPFLITAYAPDYLDDPQLTELTAGKNRTCLKFPSYAVIT